MASLQNALVCAVLATVLWSCIGLSVTSRFLPPSLAWPIAPALGWAIQGVIALPLFCLIGMARATVTVVLSLSLLLAIASLWRYRFSLSWPKESGLPFGAILGAVILASALMGFILPNTSMLGVTLTDAIFDHAKIAMIDDMARLGVPAGNPFFGESDGLDRLSYYYLWHFTAAELVVFTGLTGWEADAGLTGFTAFSSLMLMMGLAKWISARTAAVYWVLILGTVASIRSLVSLLFGKKITYAVTGWPTGFGGWSFQMSWAPQHVASAGCAVIAILLLVEVSRRQSALATIVFGFVAAAAFQSSTWIGGVTFPLAAIVIGAFLLIKIGPDMRRRFLLCVVCAAALAILLASPFIHDQLRASALRTTGSPIGIMPYDVLGDEFSETVRLVFDFPAYWTLFLFVELAAIYPVGVIMMTWLARDSSLSGEQKTSVIALGFLAIVSLCVGSILVSKLGGNNDLAWRGVLPGIIILMVFTAAGVSKYLGSLRVLNAVVVVGLIALASFSGIRALCNNIFYQSKSPSLSFADSALLWKAVRKHSSNEERIANNPLFFRDMTRWPINISWALMSNRRSCYAGADYGPFAPRTRLDRPSIDAQFERVFSGQPEPDDLDQLANRYKCSVAVVTPSDGAWTKDPFASSPLFKLADAEPQAWRIYKIQLSAKK